MGISDICIRRPVFTIVLSLMIVTAGCVAFAIGTLLGVFAGWRRGTKTDAGVTVGSTLFAAFPPFWLGLLFLYLFAYKLNALPIKGGYTPGLTPNWSLSFLDNAATHSFLPALTLAIFAGERHAWIFVAGRPAV